MTLLSYYDVIIITFKENYKRIFYFLCKKYVNKGLIFRIVLPYLDKPTKEK